MKIYLAGFLATTKEYLPDHYFFKLEKLNGLCPTMISKKIDQIQKKNLK